MRTLLSWYQTLSQWANESAEATKKADASTTAIQYKKDIDAIFAGTNDPRGAPLYGLLDPNDISPNPEDEAVYGFRKMRHSIQTVNQGLTDLRTLEQRISAIQDPAAKEKALLDAHKDLVALRDRLRTDTLALKKALHLPHILPFFENDEHRKILARRTNALQCALDARLFGERRFTYDNSRKVSIQDEHWSAKVPENTGIEASRVKEFKDSSTIIFSYKSNPGITILGSKWFADVYQKKMVHENLQLSAKDICLAVDFMKNADYYIQLWEGKLKDLEREPNNADFKKYEKYKRLLEHLKSCQKYPAPAAYDPNRTKSVTGEDSMKLSLGPRKFCIDCKDPDTKEAMLGVLKLYNEIVAEEKKEKAPVNQAGFEAELQEQEIPELQENDANLPRLGN